MIYDKLINSNNIKIAVKLIDALHIASWSTGKHCVPFYFQTNKYSYCHGRSLEIRTVCNIQLKGSKKMHPDCKTLTKQVNVF
jgi:hypothetical protein